MGSKSDLETVSKAFKVLKELEIPYEIRILSAHRTPEELLSYIKEAERKGVKVFIAAAGGAAHLPGVIASHTTLPVIGLPVKSPDLGGLDSLLSMVQMPSGVPVAVVGINRSENAALLAAQVLSIENDDIRKAISERRKKIREKVISANMEVKELVRGKNEEG
ncbi:MAG: 5-(carboxyamino)imidazole ribonucleotide mutase [Synergistetes bacterium]|nr:5-(carboxyamino)imidazole ribonucleotide mutase [Synergistota bacterium]